jgi:hypothetical protein
MNKLMGIDVVTFNLTMQKLEKEYVFIDRKQVIDFLRGYPFIVPVLLETYGEIKKHFTEDSQIALEVVANPEASDDTQLIASIKVKDTLSLEDVLEKLDAFDSEWWLSSMDKAQGRLCITVEFCKQESL